jgi:hypothetical protein
LEPRELLGFQIVHTELWVILLLLLHILNPVRPYKNIQTPFEFYHTQRTNQTPISFAEARLELL